MESKLVMTSLMNYLYSVLTDGMETFDPVNAQERFITWCLPGIPCDPAELRFAVRGIVGKGNTPEERGQDTALLLGQASRFARLVDFIPDVTGVFDHEQQLVAFHRNESALSRVYDRVLKQSQVADIPITEEEAKKIERFRSLLYVETEQEDVLTGEKQKVSSDSPLLKTYKDSQRKFEAAFQEYNAVRIAALAASTPEAVLNFSLNGESLKRRVTLALDDWAAGGHKHDVEAMMAFISQVTDRNLVLWKAAVEERMRTSRLDDALAGEFYFTTVIPGDFMSAQAGWQSHTFGHKDAEKHAEGHNTQFGGSVGINFGFGLSAQGDYTRDQTSSIESVSDFKMSFELAQIPLSRPWFDPTFLESRAWRLTPGAIEATELSDGAVPPRGMMPAYPTSVIFIRNVVIESSEVKQKMSEIKTHLAAGGSFGWGPFKLGGKYQRDDRTFDSSIEETENGIKVSGMQILGFRCHLIKKAPNPLPEITEFV